MADPRRGVGGWLKTVLVATAIAELATGLALLAAPSLVGEVLLGQPLAGAALAVARVAGIALAGLAVACWPGPPALGMLVYSSAVTVYLGFFGLMNHGGRLLWPAVTLHAVLSAALAFAVFRSSRPRQGDAG